MDRHIQETEKNPTLVGFLAARARNESDARLAANALVGFTVALVAVVWAGRGWLFIAAVGGCFMSFGAWGIADRELKEGPRGPAIARVLITTRLVAAILGAVAAITCLGVGLGVVLGVMIS